MIDEILDKIENNEEITDEEAHEFVDSLLLSIKNMLSDIRVSQAMYKIVAVGSKFKLCRDLEEDFSKTVCRELAFEKKVYKKAKQLLLEYKSEPLVEDSENDKLTMSLYMLDTMSSLQIERNVYKDRMVDISELKRENISVNTIPKRVSYLDNNIIDVSLIKKMIDSKEKSN